MRSATYAKLRSGAWGIRVTGGPVSVGETLTVTKRDGARKSESVSAVVWTDGNGTSLCAIEARDSGRRGGRRGGGGGGCHTDGNCSSVCNPATCPCGDGSWFSCC